MNDSWAISQLVSQIKEHWRRADHAPDTQAALSAHPHLRRWKSIVLDLATEEYQLRTDEGEALGAGEFCSRFPDYQRSLLHRLEIEQYLRDEEQQHALAWPKLGDRFLGYRLLEQLGKGAVGRVFLAQQIEMRDRPVVVKIAPRGQREAHTLALLNHPHIVPIYRYDEDAETGLAAICMPYLSRCTLDDFLAIVEEARNEGKTPRDFGQVLLEMQRRSPQDESCAPTDGGQTRVGKSYLDEVLNLGRQIAEALAHTHQRGVLHLDLKPSNVLLLADGRPLLLDFNLSVDGAIGASVIGGTLPYMSPEQLQEAILGRSYSSRPVDARSDVFSLGVILYELLSGRHPFGEIPRTSQAREAAKELLRRHEQGPDLGDLRHTLDQEVVRFLDACLAFHPDQRPQSAAEASATLAGLLSRKSRARRWAGAHRRDLAGAAALAGVVVFAVTLALAPAVNERWIGQQREIKEPRKEGAPADSLRVAVAMASDENPLDQEALADAKERYKLDSDDPQELVLIAAAFGLSASPLEFETEVRHCLEKACSLGPNNNALKIRAFKAYVERDWFKRLAPK